MPVVVSPMRNVQRKIASLTCDSCTVKDRSICATLSRAELVQLNAISRFEDFPAGARILRMGDRQDFFATLVSGTIKLTKGLADGREQIVALQFASDFLGRPWRSASPYEATALTDVRICRFSRTEFEELSMANPGLSHRLLAYTLDELDAAQEWLLLLGRKTALEKVASLLVMVAERAPSPDEARAMDGHAMFELPLSRGEMADVLGLSLETVCRKMTRLKSDGVVALTGGRGVLVRDLPRLRELARLDPMS